VAWCGPYDIGGVLERELRPGSEHLLVGQAADDRSSPEWASAHVTIIAGQS